MFLQYSISIDLFMVIAQYTDTGVLQQCSRDLSPSEIFVSIDAHVTLVRRCHLAATQKFAHESILAYKLQSHAYSYHVSERETKNVDIRDKIKQKGSVSLFDSEARYTNIYCKLIGKNQT